MSDFTWLEDLLGPVEFRLARAYTNEVYEVTGDGIRLALKLYGAGWRTRDEVEWERKLLGHLVKHNAPVAGAVGSLYELHDGRLAGLYAWAPGEKPPPPFTPDLYRRFGAALAQIHAVSDSYDPEFARRPLDFDLLLDEPLALASPWLEASEREFLEALGGRIRRAINPLVDRLDWGPIHGDATLDNLHVGEDGAVTLYDFDSGGPGWRAADIQGWAASDGPYATNVAAFRAGYRTVRPISAAEEEAAPWLDRAWSVLGIGIDLARRVLAQGPAATREFLARTCRELREREEGGWGV